jgi:hypothetical protein
MKKAVFVLVAALIAAAATAVNARPARSADALQLNGVFKVTFHGVTCAAGTPATTHCYLWAGPGVVPGLGQASESYVAIVDGFGTSCAHAHWTAALTVAGRGELDAAMQIPGCANQDSPNNVPATFTITGGTGTYAGAIGSGTLTSKPTETGPGSGTSTDIWSGTLSVDGLSFDTTPPTINGARTLHLQAKTTNGRRVRYALTATDPVDGNLPVTCRPRSGSRFPIGRTRVTCAATDTEGNTAIATFTVTVTHVR